MAAPSDPDSASAAEAPARVDHALLREGGGSGARTARAAAWSTAHTRSPSASDRLVRWNLRHAPIMSGASTAHLAVA
jgi:hypothetical protein